MRHTVDRKSILNDKRNNSHSDMTWSFRCCALALTLALATAQESSSVMSNRFVGEKEQEALQLQHDQQQQQQQTIINPIRGATTPKRHTRRRTQMRMMMNMNNMMNPRPSAAPSSTPTLSQRPSSAPSAIPSVAPTNSLAPTLSQQPSARPSQTPSTAPSTRPSTSPSNVPSHVPSQAPSNRPSDVPSEIPSTSPSDSPSAGPTKSQQPSTSPSDVPSLSPSDAPSTTPSLLPSSLPSQLPSTVPSATPSDSPSVRPSDAPSLVPTITPPSASPTSEPTKDPYAYDQTTAAIGEYLVYRQTCRPDEPDGAEELQFDYKYRMSVPETGTVSSVSIRRIDIALGLALAQEYMTCRDNPETTDLYLHQVQTLTEQGVNRTIYECNIDGVSKTCVDVDGILLADMILRPGVDDTNGRQRRLASRGALIQQFQNSITTALATIGADLRAVNDFTVSSVQQAATSDGGSDGPLSKSIVIIGGACAGFVALVAMVVAGSRLMRSKSKDEVAYYGGNHSNRNQHRNISSPRGMNVHVQMQADEPYEEDDDEDEDIAAWGESVVPAARVVTEESVFGDSFFPQQYSPEIDTDAISEESEEKEGVRFISTGTPYIVKSLKELEATLKELGPTTSPRKASKYQVDDTIDL